MMASDPSIPRTFEHALALYVLMKSRANADNIFEGSKTELIDEINVSRGLYSKLFGILTDLGSIHQERKGSRGFASRIVLLKEPVLEDYLVRYRGGSKSLTSVEAIARLEQRMANVEGRLPTIDLTSWIASVETTLGDLERRLSALEDSDDNL